MQLDNYIYLYISMLLLPQVPNQDYSQQYSQLFSSNITIENILPNILNVYWLSTPQTQDDELTWVCLFYKEILKHHRKEKWCYNSFSKKVNNSVVGKKEHFIVNRKEFSKRRYSTVNIKTSSVYLETRRWKVTKSCRNNDPNYHAQRRNSLLRLQ